MKPTKLIFRLLFCTFMLNVFFMSAQIDNPCATPDDFQADPPGVYSYSDDTPTLENFTPVVFNIYFWGIRRDNGTTDFALTETTALQAVARLNIEFNTFGIFFKYRGIGFFNSTTYYETDVSEIPSLLLYAKNNGLKQLNAFNVYVPYTTTGFAGAAEAKRKTSMVVNGYSLVNNSLNHEVGHCFNLGHTHDNWHNTACEHVTRDPSDPNYNANYRGDNVTDTAAVPDFLNEHYWELRDLGYTHEEALAEAIPYKYVDSDYNYIGNGTDCQDRPYEIYPIDVKNIMAYGPAAPLFAKKFTTAQKIRMHEAIEQDFYGEFGYATTTIASLYQPYKGSYPLYYPHPLPWQMPMFQPGFTYDFIECCCEYIQPAEYGDPNFSVEPNHVVKHIDKFETNYAYIYHPNHSAIVINEVDLALGAAQVQKCYDNYQTPPVLGGRIIKFNDDIFNTNVTITPKSPTEIVDPELVENLENGLYKIETNFSNGVDEEIVIYKTGN